MAFRRATRALLLLWMAIQLSCWFALAQRNYSPSGNPIIKVTSGPISMDKRMADDDGNQDAEEDPRAPVPSRRFLGVAVPAILGLSQALIPAITNSALTVLPQLMEAFTSAVAESGGEGGEHGDGGGGEHGGGGGHGESDSGRRSLHNAAGMKHNRAYRDPKDSKESRKVEVSDKSFADEQTETIGTCPRGTKLSVRGHCKPIKVVDLEDLRIKMKQRSYRNEVDDDGDDDGDDDLFVFATWRKDDHGRSTKKCPPGTELFRGLCRKHLLLRF